MASQQPKSEGSPELDAAEVERRRKQRDLKRKSRERKKRNLLELQTTAQALELEYKQLFAAKLMREQQGKQVESVAVKSEPGSTEIEQTRLVELQEKYKTVRQEMHELREQMTGFKQKLEEYERFIAMLDGHLMGFQDTQTQEEEPTS
ncbi:hypothetical protein PRIC1_006665 [Phytophthora ramorum]|uniref:uncharacterized protein n=1 Tax=Phytophthora ramorum TaxID=164328 RepID=UPI0030AD0005|nr:hypothetical protein KRP23_12824 [Phytophthora ramorum]KAH7505857.1 hypothetical protein KRP22_3827 [Phytophthora ramorum]